MTPQRKPLIAAIPRYTACTCHINHCLGWRHRLSMHSSMLHRVVHANFNPFFLPMLILGWIFTLSLTNESSSSLLRLPAINIPYLVTVFLFSSHSGEESEASSQWFVIFRVTFSSFLGNSVITARAHPVQLSQCCLCWASPVSERAILNVSLKMRWEETMTNHFHEMSPRE